MPLAYSGEVGHPLLSFVQLPVERLDLFQIAARDVIVTSSTSSDEILDMLLIEVYCCMWKDFFRAFGGLKRTLRRSSIVILPLNPVWTMRCGRFQEMERSLYISFIKRNRDK